MFLRGPTVVLLGKIKIIQIGLKKKGLDYYILQFKKKIKLRKKLTVSSAALQEVSCSFSPEVKPEYIF